MATMVTLRSVATSLLIMMAISNVASLFGPPGKKNCVKNVRYWSKHKMNFLEFKHWNDFIDCFEKISQDETFANDAQIGPYVKNKQPILSLRRILLQRDFCHGSKAQLMVDYGEKYVKPYENLNWDPNADVNIDRDADNVPELAKEPSMVPEDSEIDLDSESESHSSPLVEREEVEEQEEIEEEELNEGNDTKLYNKEDIKSTSDLLKPFRRMYYGYVSQAAKECLDGMQMRTKGILEQKPDFLIPREIDHEFIIAQEQLCNLLNIYHDPSSEKNQCHQLLKAHHLATLLPYNEDSADRNDEQAENKRITEFLSKIDAYLKSNLPEDIGATIAKRNTNKDNIQDEQSNVKFMERVVDGHIEAMGKLSKPCGYLKSRYDAILSPVTVFASAGYVIDSRRIVKKALKDDTLAKWLQIQRVCDLILRLEIEKYSPPDDSDPKAVARKFDYRINLDFRKRINGTFYLVGPNSIDYIRCRGRKNRFCGFVFIHPIRTLAIAILIGIALGALTGGLGFGVTLLVTGAAIKAASTIGGLTASIHATVSSMTSMVSSGSLGLLGSVGGALSAASGR